MDSEFIISVGVVAYNEEDFIPLLLNDMLDQTFPKSQTELLLINSMSTDRTADIFYEFKSAHKDEYKSIQLLDNPQKNQASGWNVAIDNFLGDALIRVDAHAKITEDFIKNNSECLLSGEMVCGGMRPNIIKDPTSLKNLVLLADTSMFGGSFGKYHNSEKKSYVDTLFHGCYRREVIEKVGHFNPELGRTEDNDFHQRVRSAGYKICYDPSIVSYQYSRGSVISSVRQKYGNGYWIGRTTAINPSCISLFHFVPFLFVLAIILTSVLGIIWNWLFLILLGALYGFVNILLSVISIINFKPFNFIGFLLPFMFLALHISYGIGTIFGLFSIWTNNPNKR